MNQVLRWGFMSTAHINEKVIKPIHDNPDRHVLQAVGSRSIDAAREYADRKGFKTAHGSYDDLLADPQVDTVYISLPNHLHAEWTIKACQAGKHVLCEKPMGLSVAEIDAMEAAAKSAGVVIQEAFMYRHHPQTIKIREILDREVLGKISLARATFTFLLDQPVNVRLRPEYGGGSIWDVGVYPISLLRTMIGAQPESAFGRQVIGPSGVDVAFSGELTFPGNVLGQFQSGFSASVYASAEILGEKGSLVIPTPFFPYDQTHILLIRGDEIERIEITGHHLYLGELDNMADCILRGGSPRISLADTRANTRTVLACLASAESGKVERV